MIILKSENRYPIIGSFAEIVAPIIWFYFWYSIFLNLSELELGFTIWMNSLSLDILALIAFSLSWLGKLKVETRIQNQRIIQGYRRPFRRQLRAIREINSQNLVYFGISQQEDLFFEIWARNAEGFEVLLYRFPNRIPALAKFQELKDSTFKDWPISETL